MGKKHFMHTNENQSEEPLVPTPVPALIALLLNREEEKGSPLTEEEVLDIRDNAACIMLPLSEAVKMEESRGYPDVHPQYVWKEWQQARSELNGDID